MHRSAHSDVERIVEPRAAPRPRAVVHRDSPAGLRETRPHSRVLQISKFYPPVMGGIETVAWELTAGLGRAGILADVLCSHHTRQTVVDHTPGGGRIIRAGSWGRLLSTSLAPSMIGRLRAITDDYEVLHLHMPDPMAALAVLAARPTGRLVVHWHSDVIRQRIAMHAYRHLQDWVLRRADAIIATSDEYAQSSVALRPFRDKVVTIPIGISAERYRPVETDVAAIRARFPGKRIVFSLGRLTYYKGFDVLVRAATALPDDCVVLIGGAGDLDEDLRGLVADLGLGHKVHLLGHVPDPLLAAHFAACDVFCMASTVRAEAYGVAIVEALALGKPVVATDIAGSGVPWVNRHRETGLNVPVGNPVALAAALCGLLADAGLRRQYAQAAIARFEREFRAEVMAERTLALYRSLGAAAPVAAAFPFESTRPVRYEPETADALEDLVSDTTDAAPSVRRQAPVEQAG
jgi:rhamnosyl/mannosyltransferase